MEKVKDIINVLISLALIAFIANSLFKIAFFYLHTSP
jgi:hypothetical protein